MVETNGPVESIDPRRNEGAWRLVIVLAAAALLVMCGVRAVVSWGHDANIDHVAGVWATMSQDLLHGVLYRPIYGELGYGGTRYMPAFFVLHAGLWKTLASWRVAGHAISGGSVLAIVAGVYVLLRRFAVGRALAFGAACAVLAGVGGKYTLLDMRADGMAAALNLWGVIACFGLSHTLDEQSPRRSRDWMSVAVALLFTLAFATKVTTVFGVAAVVLWLWLQGQRSLALVLSAATAAGYVLVLALTNHFSDGRFLQILRATAAGGGSSGFVISAPMRLADELTMSAPDALLLVIAVAVLVAGGRRVWRSLPALFFATTLLVTLVIFGSPGTVGNHLIDLEVASVVAIAAVASQLGRWRELVGLVLAGMMVMATLHYLQEFRDEDTENMRADYTTIEDAVRTTGKPVLCEQPLIAIEAGQRPYVLDPFMFRIFAQRDPKLAQPLWDRLDRKAFGAVVLEYDPRVGEGQYVYESVHFGKPFIERLTANYEFVKQVGDQFVWKPKGATFPELND